MLSAYCVDAISIKHLASRDQWQEPTWTTLALMGRVDWGSQLVRNAQGEQVVAGALVYLPGTVASVVHDDRIIIDGVEHVIIKIEKKVDFSKSHWEIYIR